MFVGELEDKVKEIFEVEEEREREKIRNGDTLLECAE